jgi:short subunit dehydrogenase-like uncharacterized protein
MMAILLYGATGYSGRLIAERASRRWGARGLRLIIAGRDGHLLRDLATRLDVEYRAFTLDDREAVEAGLQDVRVVVNAAGPFALTAEALALAALDTGCHYVDINGEVDVYKRLDDLGYPAEQRGLTMVCGAGHSAVASDLLLERALQHLAVTTFKSGPRELGAVRIAVSQVDSPSRGSLQTVLRTVREQVLVVRHRRMDRSQSWNVPNVHNLVLSYVPLGQLERVFDFGDGSDRTGSGGEPPRVRGRDRRPRSSRRIASAVNLIDTLTARLTVARHVDRVLRIESYLESSDALRAVHQWAALTVPFWWISAVRRLAQRQVDLLPEGPTAGEREREHLSVVLEVDDIFGHPLINWRLETPSAYDFTACSAVAVAEGLARLSPRRSDRSVTQNLAGWRTPAEILVKDGKTLDPCSDVALDPVSETAVPERADPPRAPRAGGCTIYARRTPLEPKAMHQ